VISRPIRLENDQIWDNGLQAVGGGLLGWQLGPLDFGYIFHSCSAAEPPRPIMPFITHAWTRRHQPAKIHAAAEETPRSSTPPCCQECPLSRSSMPLCCQEMPACQELPAKICGVDASYIYYMYCIVYISYQSWMYRMTIHTARFDWAQLISLIDD